MGYVYEAGEMCDLPRITVRVTEDSGNTMGVARMEGDIIWIPERTVIDKNAPLRDTVYHEILHAVFGVPHIEGDPLMGAMYERPLSKSEAQRLFKKHCPAPARNGRPRRGRRRR